MGDVPSQRKDGCCIWSGSLWFPDRPQGQERIVLHSQEGMCVLGVMEVVGVGVGEVGEKEGWV